MLLLEDARYSGGNHESTFSRAYKCGFSELPQVAAVHLPTQIPQMGLDRSVP